MQQTQWLQLTSTQHVTFILMLDEEPIQQIHKKIYIPEDAQNKFQTLAPVIAMWFTFHYSLCIPGTSYALTTV
jgi:NADH:ubiquinone oxidoreductase subunit H